MKKKTTPPPKPPAAKQEAVTIEPFPSSYGDTYLVRFGMFSEYHVFRKYELHALAPVLNRWLVAQQIESKHELDKQHRAWVNRTRTPIIVTGGLVERPNSQRAKRPAPPKRTKKEVRVEYPYAYAMPRTRAWVIIENPLTGCFVIGRGKTEAAAWASVPKARGA